MDSSGFGTGSSLADEERPVLTGNLDKEAWIAGLQDYVNSMKERCMDTRHPSCEWFSAGLSMICYGRVQLTVQFVHPFTKTKLKD